MQLSVAKYKAIARGRGATLDTIDVPLNDRAWLERPVRRDPQARVARRTGCRAIDAILGPDRPGPGRLLRRPRRPCRGSRTSSAGPGFADDPDFRRSALRRVRATAPAGRWPGAATPRASTTPRSRCITTGSTRRPATGSGSSTPATTSASAIRLDADGEEIHALIEKPDPPRPVEFDIPAGATADGELTLRWTREPGLGGNGRGCQVAEVWLIRAGP